MGGAAARRHRPRLALVCARRRRLEPSGLPICGSSAGPAAARPICNSLTPSGLTLGRQAERWAGTPGLAHLLKHHARLVATVSLGLGQCTVARCLFNGVGCDEEMAAAPFAPCPVCLRKLVASRAVLSARRLFEDLLAFCLKHDAAAGGAFAHEVAALRLRLRQLDGVAIPGATCERA